MSAEQSHHTKGLVRLTMACNERCPFCNVPAERYPTRPRPEAELLAEVDALLRAGGRTLTISGGEPTLLRRRLLSLVREARRRGAQYVELQTNAVLIDPAYAAALAAAGVSSAFVSLLSHLPAQHDHLAGLGGAYGRCLSGIDALLDAGIRVALNPVIARSTQALVADYVDFVAARLPRVRSISLSAVQPHGRAAARAAELLPDYATLAGAIREARRRALRAGITLLNPYCGLPLCIGWEGDIARSVEAIEGAARAAGLDNRGNKRQGPPCRPCALRTRCGGAWHAYWALRGGSGIRPPALLGEPWGEPGPLECVVDGRGGLDEGRWAALADAESPAVWLRLTRLPAAAVRRLLGSGCTDLALDWGPPDRETLRALRRLDRLQRGRDDRARLRVTAAIAERDPRRAYEQLSLAAALGVRRLRLADRALAERLSRALPELDISAAPSSG